MKKSSYDRQFTSSHGSDVHDLEDPREFQGTDDLRPGESVDVLSKSPVNTNCKETFCDECNQLHDS